MKKKVLFLCTGNSCRKTDLSCISREIREDTYAVKLLSRYPKAMEIANILKAWDKKDDFLLSQPVTYLPGPETGYSFKPLKERLIE